MVGLSCASAVVIVPINNVPIQNNVIFFNLLFMESSLSGVFDVLDLPFQLFQPVVYLVQTFCNLFIPFGWIDSLFFDNRPGNQCDQDHEKEPDAICGRSEPKPCWRGWTRRTTGYKWEKNGRIDPQCPGF